MTGHHPRTGQFGVVRTKGFVPWMIRLFTRSQVNHAYVYISETYIVEAQRIGAVMAKATKYAESERAESNFWLMPDEAHDISREAQRLLGRPYGFLDILCITLALFGLRYKWLLARVESSRTLICSQLVDRAYDNAGCHLYSDGRPDGLVTPGDLLMFLAQDHLPGLPEIKDKEIED